MADTKISALTEATTLAATDEFVVASSGATERVTLATLRSEFAVWASYTPALTGSVSDPTLGTGSSVVGRWMRLGDLGIVFARINFGTSGTAAGSGNYRISLPFTVGASQITIQGGLTILEDNSASDAFSAAGYGIAGQAYAQMYLAQATTTGLVTHAVPFAWAANDIIAATIICEIA